METSTMDNGKMGQNGVKEYIVLKMEINMKENGKKIKNMENLLFIMQTEADYFASM